MANAETGSTQKAPDGAPRKMPNGEGRTAGVIKDYIAVARGSDLVVIRVVGQGTMLTAPALAEFAEQQLKAGFRRFVFDLERCRGLDSTFVGMMVGIQMALGSDEGQLSRPPLTLPSPQRGEGGVRGQTPPTPPAAMPLGTEPAAPAPWAEGMSPDEAVAALKVLFADPASAAAELGKAACTAGVSPAQTQAGGTPAVPAGLVSAVNVPADLANLLAMLGVDRFVRLRGTYDLGQLETAILAEKNLPPDEQRRLILKAHDTLIEIDQRNQAHFGPFLKSLSQALEQ